MVEQLEIIRAAVQLESAGPGPGAQLCALAQQFIQLRRVGAGNAVHRRAARQPMLVTGNPAPQPAPHDPILAARTRGQAPAVDRSCVLTELRDVAAAQRATRALSRAQLLTGMSCSAGADTAESGHLLPNRSPTTSSSVLLVGIGYNPPATDVGSVAFLIRHEQRRVTTGSRCGGLSARLSRR